MTVYIPCYFNNIIDRENNFYIILNQYLELGYSVIVYWMNSTDILISNSKVKVIIGEKVNASIARNKLLEIFYKSEEEYALFSDDDTYLKNNIIEYKECISFTNDYTQGIKETERISSALLLLKNFNKYYNIKPYFDESLEANQDLDFGITLNKLGIKTHRKSTDDVIIYKGPSSMFNSNMNKLNKKQKSLNYIINKHGKYN